VNHKELKPIDAYSEEQSGDHVTYANIVPSKSPPTEANDQPPQPVIYAELAPTQPPVVDADTNA